MSSLYDQLRREARVAFSLQAQPLGLRVLKWMVFGGVTAYLWGTAGFWFWIAGVLAAGIGLHLLWRSKTKGWTEPWGGWDDVESARDPSEESDLDENPGS